MAATPDWRTRATSRLLRWVLVSWGSTWRWDETARRSAEEVVERIGRDGPVIFAVWHEHILPYALWMRKFVLPRRPVTVLVSASGDGDLGALAAATWGARVVRGSSTRGGAVGARGLARAIRDDRTSLAFLADGPKGPARVLKPGAPMLARLSGAPILPVAAEAGSSRRLGTWDRMVLPSPFTPVGVRLGDPIHVAREDDPETARERVEGELLSLL